MYMTDSSLWWKLLLLVAVVGFIFWLFSFIMRKLLKVERKGVFSYNHVNEHHKKIDWGIRITSMVLLVIWFISFLSVHPNELPWYFDLWVIVVISFSVSGVVQALMEWKYAENRKAYILTISETAFGIVVVISVISAIVFGVI